MSGHGIWVFLHVMLLVYWLGADLGVFVLARAAKRPSLSFAERAFALRMATVIDLVPRLCFTVMFPVGLHVADSGGWVQVPSWAFGLAWTVAAGWIDQFGRYTVKRRNPATNEDYIYRKGVGGEAAVITR